MGNLRTPCNVLIKLSCARALPQKKHPEKFAESGFFFLTSGSIPSTFAVLSEKGDLPPATERETSPGELVSLFCGSVCPKTSDDDRRRGRPSRRLEDRRVFRDQVLLTRSPTPRRRSCTVQGLAEENLTMREPGLSKKRERVKTVRRSRWAKPLIRPATLKTIMALGRLAAQLLHLMLSIIKLFRQ